MNKLKKHFLLGAIALGFGVAGMGSAVSAPPPPDQAEWGCGYGQGMGRNWDSAQFGERMKQRMNQRHAALHDKLKLNQQQEAAWKTYTDATATNMTPPSWNREEMSKLTAPERMDKMLERMKEREQRMAAQRDALKTFYATLTPEQQKIFDAEWAQGPRRQGRMAK